MKKIYDLREPFCIGKRYIAWEGGVHVKILKKFKETKFVNKSFFEKRRNWECYACLNENDKSIQIYDEYELISESHYKKYHNVANWLNTHPYKDRLELSHINQSPITGAIEIVYKDKLKLNCEVFNKNYFPKIRIFARLYVNDGCIEFFSEKQFHDAIDAFIKESIEKELRLYV